MIVSFGNNEVRFNFDNENTEPNGIYHGLVEATWDDPETGEERKGLMERHYLRVTFEDKENERN